jgi:NAD(P)-dependent dehydrogenase (short-subunit alcohol dehydrogenase family)
MSHPETGWEHLLKLKESTGKIDIPVNNAGISPL